MGVYEKPWQAAQASQHTWDWSCIRNPAVSQVLCWDETLPATPPTEQTLYRQLTSSLPSKVQEADPCRGRRQWGLLLQRAICFRIALS